MNDFKNNLIGSNLTLRILTPHDVTQEYVDWMNDSNSIQFTESRRTEHTLESIKQYVSENYHSENDFLFGIFVKENGNYIGNIKIGSVHQFHKFANIGILIGNERDRGKGHGSEAIILVTNYAFTCLKLNKLYAGIHENNKALYKAFMKADYTEAGRMKRHRRHEDTYCDEIIVEKIVNNACFC